MFGFRGMSQGGAVEVFIWVFAVFFSILIHELGHAFMMIRFGEGARVVLYGMGGLAIPERNDSFFSRPVSRDMVRQVLISAAGPGAGFLLAALILGILAVVPTTGFVVSRIFFVIPFPMVMGIENQAVNSLVNAMLYINIFWGIVNLVPVFPLDGGQISRALFTHYDGWDGTRKSLWLSVVCGAILAVMGLSISFFITIMFGLLAYQSWQMLQQITGGRPW